MQSKPGQPMPAMAQEPGGSGAATAGPGAVPPDLYSFEVQPLVPRLYTKYRRLVLGVAGIALLLIAWQVCATLKIVDPAFSSYPTQIARSMVTYFESSTGWTDLAATAEEFAIGIALTLAIGIPLGIAAGWYHALDDFIDPLVSFLYNAPRIALAPLLIVWFGIGITSKVATVIITAIFPVMISARGGVRDVDPVLISMARSHGAGDLKILRTIVVPGAVAPLSSGIRIGIGQGLAGAVFAEYIGASKGLGYAINNAASSLNTPLLFDAIIVIAVLGVVITAVVRSVEERAQRWRI